MSGAPGEGTTFAIGFDATPEGWRWSCSCGWRTPWVPTNDDLNYRDKRQHMIDVHGLSEEAADA